MPSAAAAYKYFQRFCFILFGSIFLLHFKISAFAYFYSYFHFGFLFASVFNQL